MEKIYKRGDLDIINEYYSISSKKIKFKSCDGQNVCIETYLNYDKIRLIKQCPNGFVQSFSINIEDLNNFIDALNIIKDE